MNAERLLEVVDLLRYELQEVRVYEPLERIVALLAPGGNRRQARVLASELAARLLSTASNALPPSRLLIATSIGATKRVGAGLAHRLTTLVEDDRLSLSESATLIRKLNEEILNFEGTLNNHSNFARQLGIHALVVPDGHCEVGVLYPFPGTIRTLEDLARETSELDSNFRSIAEIGGQPGSPRLWQVSTTDLHVFFLTTAGIGAALAKTLDWILESYKKTLEIRLLRIEIEEKKIQQEAAKLLREREAEVERQGIESAVAGVLELYPAADPGRKHELRILVDRTVRFMLLKVHEGVIFEVVPATRTSDGKPVTASSSDQTPPTDEARQLAIAGAHGAVMKQLAVQRTLQALPESTRSRHEADG